MRERSRFSIKSVLALTIVLISPAAVGGAPGQAEYGDKPRIEVVDPDLLVKGRSLERTTKSAIDLLVNQDLEDLGDFQTEDGRPSWDGWLPVDKTEDRVNHWEVDSDTALQGSYSMWCGQRIRSCGSGEPTGGYGNDYDEYLDLVVTVDDPDGSTDVHITALISYDTEPDTDYLFLEYEDAGGMQVLASWTGYGSYISVDETFNIDHYVDTDKLHLRWRAYSDGLWSDEDCLFPSSGLARVDDINVTIDSGAPLVDNFEDGTAGNWTVPLKEGRAGNFAHVWPQLNELDTCEQNMSPVVAFIDDGVVEPGTGGTIGSTWTYGPGGFVFDPEGGLLGPGHAVDNEIWSPILVRGDLSMQGVRLVFDVYSHLELFNGVFYDWKVRSTANPILEPLEDAPWQTDTPVYQSYQSRWKRRSFELGSYLVPGWLEMQVALSAKDYGEYFVDYNDTDTTPAPYFDNVSVEHYGTSGPLIIAEETHLAQDSFPEAGLNPSVLSENWVRFDMAANISPPEDMRNDPGDSISFTVESTRVGGGVYGTPTIQIIMDANSLFDDDRVLPPGFSQADTIITGSVAAFTESGPGHYFFDLPDSTFFFPGDVIQYYILAGDIVEGDIEYTTLPSDVSSFGDFSVDSPYSRDFTVRALPSLKSDLSQPSVLFVNESARYEGLNAWTNALRYYGYLPGLDYDPYFVRGALSGVGNGIGGRATSAELSDYQTILYACGSNTNTLGDAQYGPYDDPSNDIEELEAWLGQGSKNLMLCGSNLVSDLWNNLPGGGIIFMIHRMGMEWVDGDLTPWIGAENPVVDVVPGNPVFSNVASWSVEGECPLHLGIDVVQDYPPLGCQALATYPDMPSSQYEQAATLHLSSPDARVVYLPYDLSMIPGSSSAWNAPLRNVLLMDILDYFQTPQGSGDAWIPPDVNVSHVEMVNPVSPVSVFTIPGGAGAALDHARADDGSIVDGSIRVTLLSIAGDPVYRYPGEDLWLATDSGGFVACHSGSIADADTDENGETYFSGALSGGGYSGPGELVDILVAGELLNQIPGFDIRVNSPDIDGDLQVTLADQATFIGDMNAFAADPGDYEYRSDFFWDGTLDLSDLVLMDYGQEVGVSCSAHPGKMDDPPTLSMGDRFDAPKTPPDATIGVFFDTEGQSNIISAETGQVITAYVILDAQEPTGVRGAAWSLTLPACVTHMSTVYGGISRGVSHLEGVEHGLGLCADAGPDRPVVLATVQFFVSGSTGGLIELSPHTSSGYSDFVYADCWGEKATNVSYAGPAVVSFATDTGTINIEPGPVAIDAPWTLTGPESHTGSGEAQLDVPVGIYTIVWEEPVGAPGWYRPCPATEAQMLTPDGDITFSGHYLNDGTPQDMFGIFLDEEATSLPYADYGIGESLVFYYVIINPSEDDMSWCEGSIPIPTTELTSPIFWEYLHTANNYVSPPDFQLEYVVPIDFSGLDAFPIIRFNAMVSGTAPGVFDILASATTATVPPVPNYTSSGGVVPLAPVGGGGGSFLINPGETGVLTVEVTPDAAPWTLIGPYGLHLGGQGDEPGLTLPAGGYRLVFEPLNGHALPEPSTECGELIALGLTLSGTYLLEYEADLVLTKDVDDATPTAGQVVTYTITLDNDGPDAATGILVSDPLPAGLISPVYTPEPGTTFDAAVWTVPTLAPGGDATLLVSAEIAAAGGTEITNTAVVTALDQYDPTPAQASADLTVEANSGLVHIRPGPAAIGAPWEIAGPQTHSGSGPADLSVISGSYTVTWGEPAGHPGWDLPCPAQQAISVGVGAELDVIGNYLHDGTAADIVGVYLDTGGLGDPFTTQPAFNQFTLHVVIRNLSQTTDVGAFEARVELLGDLVPMGTDLHGATNLLIPPEYQFSLPMLSGSEHALISFTLMVTTTDPVYALVGPIANSSLDPPAPCYVGGPSYDIFALSPAGGGAEAFVVNPATGTINVDVTPDTAGWRLLGRYGYNRTDTGDDSLSLPVGHYRIVWLDHAGFDSPDPAESCGELTAGGTLDFSGVYVAISDTVHVATTGDDATGDGSHANPFRTIQHGLDNAPVDGTVAVHAGVYSTSTNGEVLPVQMRDGITVWAEDGPGTCVIDGDGTSRDLVFNGSGTARLEGFEIVGGLGNPTGGGVHCDGGGTLELVDCRLANNTAPGSYGGAIRAAYGTLVIDTCVFENNTAGFGGAIAVDHVDLQVLDSVITNNDADTRGGGIYWLYDHGGAGVLDHCVFAGNTSGENGGALHCAFTSPSFENCTIHENTAGGEGSALSFFGSTTAPSVIESILAFNPGNSAVTCGDNATVTLECSDVYGNVGGDWTGCLAGQLGVLDNFSADPLFCDAGVGDLSLRANSPCLGINSPCGEYVGALLEGCAELHPPMVTDIPDQTVSHGAAFASIALDDYVSDVEDPDDALIWGYSGNVELLVDITDRVATVTKPDPDWSGSETILFTATDTDAMSDADSAIFTTEAAPEGTIEIIVEPGDITAPWTLYGPSSLVQAGSGDDLLNGMEPGTYNIVWGELGGWITPSAPPSQILAAMDTLTFAGLYGDPLPLITEVSDVPNDQGRRLRLVWDRSVYDAPGSEVAITGYEVYREQGEFKTADPPSRLEGWDFLSFVPAHGDDVYQFVAETLCDSTASGVCLSTFFLRTTTPDPFTYYDTSTIQGYSIDNLVPGMPLGLVVDFAASGNHLSWDENDDPDIQAYVIYRGLREDCSFDSSSALISVPVTTWSDDLAGMPGAPWDYCYFVTAVDAAGNEGEPTRWEGAEITGVNANEVPDAFALHQCYPNPFNPSTTIRFDLAVASEVDLLIFDTKGRIVRTLRRGVREEAGRKETTWNGLDDFGRRVASGIYFCRLRAGAYSEIRRMALMK